MSIILWFSAFGMLGFAVPAAFFKRNKESGGDCGLGQAWDHYVANLRKWSTRDQRAIDRLSADHDRTSEEIKRSLDETVQGALATSNPLAPLRKAIMDATDRFVLAESMSDPTTDADHSRSVVEVGVLRCFSMLRFEDYATEDWYSHYLKMAEMNSKNVASMVRKTVSGEQTSMETSLHDALSGTMRQVREALLRYPPRTPVKRADKLTSREAPVRPYPSQQEIDRLTDVMSERFEKLFAGQVYQVESGPLVDPAGAFQVDAGLLYALLGVHFRHPTDGWQQIMDRALGSYREAMQNQEQLLETGRRLHRVWAEHAQDGPLSVALKVACECAFPKADQPGSDGPEALASIMMEDAAVLIGAINKVVANG